MGWILFLMEWHGWLRDSQQVRDTRIVHDKNNIVGIALVADKQPTRNMAEHFRQNDFAEIVRWLSAHTNSMDVQLRNVNGIIECWQTNDINKL